MQNDFNFASILQELIDFRCHSEKILQTDRFAILSQVDDNKKVLR